MKVPIAHLRVFTLIYICFPLIPFFGGWLKPVFGVPLIGLLLWGVLSFAKDQSFAERESFSKRNLLIGLSILIIWLLFSGAGGMGFQFNDHVKNNSLIKELSEIPWPVSYDVTGEKMYLAHYLSFYIVGPFVGGLLGYKYAQLAVFLWTGLGTVLGAFWLARATGRFSWKFFLFFVLFGGVVLVSFILKYETDFLKEILHRTSEHGLVFWMNSWDIIPLNYLHITDMIYWTPQHMIPAFLGIGILLNDGFIDKNIKYTPFLLSLLAMWSPLILVGIAPFFIYVLLEKKFKNVFNSINLVIAPILFLVVGSFLLSIESGNLVKHFIFSYKGVGGHTLLEMIGVFVYFVFFEVLIWLVPIYLVLRKTWSSSERRLFYTLAFVLVCIPFYRFGLWNDWCNRVSMPGIVLMSVFAYKAIYQSKGTLRKVMLIIFLCGAVGPLMDFVGSARSTSFVPRFRPPLENHVQTLPEICESLGYPISQFVAPEDAFFFKYLAKKP